jgi:hypothetical protein
MAAAIGRARLAASSAASRFVKSRQVLSSFVKRRVDMASLMLSDFRRLGRRQEAPRRFVKARSLGDRRDACATDYRQNITTSEFRKESVGSSQFS